MQNMQNDDMPLLKGSPLLVGTPPPAPDAGGLLTSEMRSRIKSVVGAGLQNTDVALDLCKSTNSDLCPMIAALCEGRHDAKACANINSLCRRGGIRLRTSACLRADADVCDASLQLCRGKTDGVCGLLTNLCAAK